MQIDLIRILTEAGALPSSATAHVITIDQSMEIETHAIPVASFTPHDIGMALVKFLLEMYHVDPDDEQMVKEERQRIIQEMGRIRPPQEQFRVSDKIKYQVDLNKEITAWICDAPLDAQENEKLDRVIFGD